MSLLLALSAALAAYAGMMGYVCQGAFCAHGSGPQPTIYDRLFAWAWAQLDPRSLVAPQHRDGNGIPNDYVGTFDDDYAPETWEALAQRGSRLRVETITHAQAWRLTRGMAA